MKRAPLFFIVLFTFVAMSLAMATSSARAEKKKREKSDAAAESSLDRPKKSSSKTRTAAANAPANAENRDGQAEARLIDIYKMIGQAKIRDAVPFAESLVRDYEHAGGTWTCVLRQHFSAAKHASWRPAHRNPPR